MGGGDPSIAIPSVLVTQADGATLRSSIAGGLDVTLRLDPALDSGADGGDRVLLYSPTTYAAGSSVSHWDLSVSPDLLMEPILSSSVSSDVDLTLGRA